MRSVSKDFGQPFKYDPEFKGAIIDRQSTDIRCLILFVIIAILWIISGIIGIASGNVGVLNITKRIDTVTSNKSREIEAINEMADVFPTFLGSLFIGIVICLALVALMRWMAVAISWASIFIVLTLIGGIVIVFIPNYVDAKKRKGDLFGNESVPQNTSSLSRKKTLNVQNDEAFLYLLGIIFFSVVFTVIVICLICCRSRITLAIQFIKEGSEAVSSSFSTIFLPVIETLLELCVILFGLWTILMWSTSGEIFYKIQRVNHYQISAANDSTNSTVETNPLVGQNCTIPEFEKNCNASCENLQCVMSIAPRKFFYFYIVFTIFEFFWILSFLSAVLEMVLAGIFATWYWTFNKNELDGNVRSSFYRTFRYHLGTTAFGALILAIVKFLRFIMETIQKQLQEGSTNIGAIICTCLCRCCLEMLENFLSFLNRNAYIMTAVHGTDFIDSAKSAFNLLKRNLLNVIVLDKVTDLVFFVIKFLFSLATATIFYFVFNCLHQDNKFRVGFTIIFFILMFLISSVLFSVFSMAIDTIFLCYLEDLERNDGSPGRPYFMSTKLKRLLQPKI